MAKRRCEMRLAHDTYVVVADGDKMLLFRNQGGAEYPKLELQSELVQDNPADREQGTAQPGRASNSVGSHRSAFQEPDFHELEQASFAALTAELLKKRALKKEYEKLIVVRTEEHTSALPTCGLSRMETRSSAAASRGALNSPTWNCRANGVRIIPPI